MYPSTPPMTKAEKVRAIKKLEIELGALEIEARQSPRVSPARHKLLVTAKYEFQKYKDLVAPEPGTAGAIRKDLAEVEAAFAESVAETGTAIADWSRKLDQLVDSAQKHGGRR